MFSILLTSENRFNNLFEMDGAWTILTLWKLLNMFISKSCEFDLVFLSELLP
jgi:hypothetical protein